MNKELYKKDIGEKIKELKINDESLTIVFETSELVLTSNHDSDCCEHVYADFTVMKSYQQELLEKEIEYIQIKGVKDMGFLLVFKKGYSEYTKIFVPCYNYQNGYYSKNLSLKISYKEVNLDIDITDLVEDHEG